MKHEIKLNKQYISDLNYVCTVTKIDEYSETVRIEFKYKKRVKTIPMVDFIRHYRRFKKPKNYSNAGLLINELK